MLTLQMPALPDPVRVSLKPATTALLVFDVVDPICKNQPKCTGVMVPAIASLLAQARKAGVFVLYSTRAPNISKWLPEVAPAPGDPIITSYAQDRFYNTDLDNTLKAKGITTVILTGWKVSGSVVYTSVGATLRGYTVVVPTDASLAATDYEVAIGVFQILNSEQRERYERAAEDESLNLEPYGYDHLSVEKAQRSAPLLSSLADNFLAFHMCFDTLSREGRAGIAAASVGGLFYFKPSMRCRIAGRRRVSSVEEDSTQIIVEEQLSRWRIQLEFNAEAEKPRLGSGASRA